MSSAQCTLNITLKLCDPVWSGKIRNTPEFCCTSKNFSLCTLSILFNHRFDLRFTTMQSGAMTEQSYHPSLSRMSGDELQKWLAAPIIEDIKQVPGMDQKNAELLKEPSDAGDGISTSIQLLGVFLLCKGQGVQAAENCSRFHNWLQAKGITHNTSTIVKAVAEKCNKMIPGIYSGEFNHRNPGGTCLVALATTHCLLHCRDGIWEWRSLRVRFWIRLCRVIIRLAHVHIQPF